jgi:CRISPR-associated protein Cst1
MYTGHPLVDVGVATITAFAHKYEPSEVTSEELALVRQYIEDRYTVRPMNSVVSVVFTTNSDYLQPSWTLEKRREMARLLLNGDYPKHKVGGQKCVFCGRSASMKAFRQYIPLFGGEGAFNFYPEGGLGIPVCSACMLAIQAFPLGSAKCNGRVLIVHSDCNEVTYAFASRFLEKNLNYLQMASLEKIPDMSFPRTLLLETLLSIEEDRLRINRRRPCSITAYHLTNYGTSANVTLYHLPLGVMNFILDANTPTYRQAWNDLVARGWELSRAKSKKTKPEDQEKGESRQRNFFYEDLFTLPEQASRFLRTYFLRRPIKSTSDTDPRRTYSLSKDLGLISWQLTELFLERVMNMDQTRITAIKQVADKLADYAIRQDERLFLQIHRARGYPELRWRLINASISSVKAGGPPLLSFEDFIEVFEEGEDIARPDWSLARDLVLIRMIERMHQAGVFSRHPELVQEAAETAQTVEEETRPEPETVA